MLTSGSRERVNRKLKAQTSRLPGAVKSSARSRRKRTDRPTRFLEILEPRLAPSVYTVMNTYADGRPNSLPWAVAQADADTAGTATIDFADGPGQTFAIAQSIQLTGTLDLKNSTSSITIQGPRAGVTILGINSSTSASAFPSTFTVEADTKAALDGLTIAGGNNNNNAYYTEGGGITNSGTLTVSNCLLTGNQSDYGGAIDNQGDLTVNTTTFYNNTASYSGGAILNDALSTLSIADSSFLFNSSPIGGAVFNAFGSTLIASNSTIADNSADYQAGGLYFGNSLNPENDSSMGSYLLDNVTVALNHVANLASPGSGIYDGGGIYAEPASLEYPYAANLTLNNSIVAANTGGNNTPNDIVGTNTVQGTCNLIGAGGSGGLPNTVASGNQLNVQDPGLGDVGDYGGPTPTVPLVLGSPAIGRGSASLALSDSSNDQRGLSRTQPGDGSVDIGAFQTQPIVVNTAADPASGLDGSYTGEGFGLLSLREAINLANDLGGNNTITFASSMNGATITPVSSLSAYGKDGTESIDGAGQIAISGSGLTGVFMLGGNVALFGLTIENGRAYNGGGVYNYGTLAITNTTFAGNTATTGGGAVYNYGTLAIANTTFAGNTATTGGGGIYNSGALTVTSCTFQDENSAATDGGAIYNQGMATISGCTFAGNSATGTGGGIYDAGTATISYSTFTANSASSGGAIFNSTSLSVTSSILSDNSATGGGGGIYDLGAATISNSTFAGNSASSGGALYFAPSSTGSALTDDTIAANWSTVSASVGQGGGLFADPSCSKPVTLSNTIVAGNFDGTSPSTASDDIAGTVDAGSAYNVIGDGAGMSGISNAQGHNQVGTSASPISPLLAPLGNYGGPTPTMMLLPGSPAIDAGSNSLVGIDPSTGERLATDQRGFSRIYPVNGQVDIGAFEAQPVLATSLALSPSASPAVYGQTVTFTATVFPAAPIIGTPTGSVTFDDGFDGRTTVLGTVMLSDGTATFTIASLGVGSQSITAVYGGDTNYVPCRGALTETVNQDPTTTVVGALSNPSLAGQMFTLAATVTADAPGAGTPSGTIDFYNATTGTDLGTVPLALGAADLTIGPLSVGPYNIVAKYSGDGNFTASTGSFVQAVDGPTLGVNSVVVSGDVGTVATSSGTWSDNVPNATVWLSASIGQVTENQDGTWTWSYTVPPGGATDTMVTISAQDSAGATGVSTQFYLNTTIILVTNTNESGLGSLQDAINTVDASTANVPALISFAAGLSGTITASLNVSHDMSIVGPARAS